MQNRMLKISDVQNLLGMSRSGVYALIQGGELVPVKIGRSVRFSERYILEWIESRQDQAVKESA